MRQGIEGGGDPLASVLFLVIAIQIFQLSGEQKALIVASKAIGFCLAPFVPLLFASSRMRRSTLAGICNILSGISLLLAAITTLGWGYVIFSGLFTFFLCVKVSLFSQIYRNNYSSVHRGRMFSFGATLRNICNLVFNILAAIIMNQRLEWFRWLFVVYALLMMLSGIICFGIPSLPFRKETSSSLRSFWSKFRAGPALILRDRLFLYICFAWYLLGFGNLALIPMRVEFLVQDFSISTLGLVFILQIIPGLIRVSATLWGGRMFDRIPPLSFRIIINLLVALGIVVFFHAGSWPFLIVGIIMFGLSEAGGQFVWNLWMTHLAPRVEDVELYMGVHVFLTGTRGLIAPFVSYALLEWKGQEGQNSFGLANLSWFSVALVLLSTLLFVSMARSPRVNRRS